MFKINEKLIIREDDNSLFSLDNMEVYEFNEIGFKAIMLIKEGQIDSLNHWIDEIGINEGVDTSEMEGFLSKLIDAGIVIGDING